MRTSAPSLRERRIAETSARLTRTAREWTVTRGFGGFTVDELCEEAGVSRRTFFNYFATKEDVVLGILARVDHTPLEDAFVAVVGERMANGLSAALLGDLAELMIARWEALGLGAEHIEALFAAVEAAPRVLGRAIERTREQEREDIALVERREGLPAGDLRASTAVHLLGSLLRAAVEETLRGTGEVPLRSAFARRLATVRGIFSDEPLRTERTS
jgi:AcrR family transcriptional regulator